MRRFRRPPPAGLIIVAGLLSVFGTLSSVSAQSVFGRSGAPAAGAAISGVQAPAKPTIESVSRDAQRAIRACDDSVALSCVANELTKYAEALQQIAPERREPAAVPQGRHAGCSSRNHKLCRM